MATGRKLIFVLINISILFIDNTNGDGDCTGIPNCAGDLCKSSFCPKYPDASCKLVLDHCGNCRASFVSEDDVELEDCFDLSSGPCLPRLCKPDPCTTAACPNQPGAQCSSDTCTGCRAQFSLGGGVLTEAECMLGSGPSIIGCPSPVPCDSNPCIGASCPALTAAVCRPNYCDCKAEFFIGNRKIEDQFCVELEPCPGDVPLAGCLSPPGEICMGQRCPLFPDAKCVIDGCGGCNVIFFDGRRRLTDEDCNGCPPFAPRDCNPCEDAVCADHPDARCEPRRCGMCKAVFFGADRKEIKSCCKEEFCEDGSPVFQCKKNPCDGAVCLTYPTSICIPNYCGGCKAEFMTINGRKLTNAECVPREFCPPDLPLAGCAGGPCLGETCPMYPGAECVIDTCNGCRVIFYYGRKRLTYEDCNGCPNVYNQVCYDDPCEFSTCQGYPLARCEPQVCGQCKARYFGPDRKEVRCGAPSHSMFCDDGMIRFDCIVNPCDVVDCPGNPDAECRPNYCDGCNAEFFVGNTRVSESTCVEKEICPGDVPVAGCQGPPGAACLGSTCPNYPEAECFIDGCNGCNVVFYNGRTRLTQEDCQGCPDGSPRVACVNPCENALCPLYPEARCEARVCGQCSAVFFGLDRRQIMDCCGEDPIPIPPTLPPLGDPCPDHMFQAKCSSTPKCLGETCPRYPEAQCRIDGCGGCKAIFYDGMRRLTDEDCNGCMSPFPPRQCDACKNARCPEISNARCEARKCGTCRAVFFAADRSEIDSCCEDGERCSDGTIRFQCLKNPCDDATCPGRKRATCKPNYCGGCKADFYQGKRKLTDLDCVERESCPRGFPVTNCPRKGCFCPNYKDAKCIYDGCGGTCKTIYYSKGKRLTLEDCFGCPRGDKVKGCEDPCDGAGCLIAPTARCEPRTCGQCMPIFYGQDRNRIDCGTDSGNCADGKRRFTCSQDPCSVATCPGVTTTNCISNFCGGCFAEFYYENGERVPEHACAEREPCPGDLPVARCIDVCSSMSCPRYPDAVCKTDGCAAACDAIFYDGRRRLTDEDCNGCPSGQTMAKDCDDPCKNALCPLYPDARCEARRCGMCRAAFFGADRQEIESCCEGPPTPVTPTPACDCDPLPCDVASCPNHPFAICIPNCGDCSAEFMEGDMVYTQEQCGGGITCPGNKIFNGCGSMCQDTCHKRHTGCNAACQEGCFCPLGTVMLEEGSDSCVAPKDCPKSQCPGDKVYTRCASMCLDSCVTKHTRCQFGCNANTNCVCPPGTIMVTDGSDKCVKPKQCPRRPDTCPPGVPIVLCKANPCKVTSCPGEPAAVCIPNYCGGCNADFFLGKKKLTDLECVKNPDECIAFTTCSSDTCYCPSRPFSTCVVQYCAPNSCTALYFDQHGKKLTNEECGICPDRAASINCGIIPPCLLETCPAFPTAKCHSSNCGKCKTWFTDLNGNTVDCEIKTKIRCKVPKSISHGAISPNNKDMINEGERVIYRCDNGFNLRGSKTRICKDRKGRGVLSGVPPHCHDDHCPASYSTESCRKDCRSNYECGTNKMCCRSGCSHRCLDIPDLCPDGDAPVQCYVDPCLTASCPRYPEAKCRANYCGGCKADWYYKTKKLLPFDCEQPEDIRCPSLRVAIPLCIDLCHGTCKPLQACCFNGCGHQCYGY